VQDTVQEGYAGTLEVGGFSIAGAVSAWPQPDDLGVVAETDQPIGATWLRFFTASDPGYGFIDAAIPRCP